MISSDAKLMWLNKGFSLGAFLDLPPTRCESGFLVFFAEVNSSSSSCGEVLLEGVAVETGTRV